MWLEHTKECQEYEAEANFFAGYLLAPVPLIMNMEIDSSVDICEAFNVSLEAASNTLSRVRKRKSINKNLRNMNMQ